LIALSLLGDRMTWLTVRAMVHADASDLPGHAFLHVAETLHNHWFEERDHQAVLASLNALRDAEFGGIAAMLEALPAYPQLTLHTLP
jgi:hypothetical protein